MRTFFLADPVSEVMALASIRDEDYLVGVGVESQNSIVDIKVKILSINSNLVKFGPMDPSMGPLIWGFLFNGIIEKQVRSTCFSFYYFSSRDPVQDSSFSKMTLDARRFV